MLLDLVQGVQEAVLLHSRGADGEPSTPFDLAPTRHSFVREDIAGQTNGHGSLVIGDYHESLRQAVSAVGNQATEATRLLAVP